jgi:hypothetical protein
MSKTLVFFADGTWNGPKDVVVQPAALPNSQVPQDGHSSVDSHVCQPQHTNVCKLFAWLKGDLQPGGTTWGGIEMEKVLNDAQGQPVQMAKYIHGVGNSSAILDKVAGGAFGVGVTARIARGYTYLSRNYKPGDRIVIVGFSRGAYTARALAGLVAGQGLLKPELVGEDNKNRYDTAVAAWYRWRHGHETTFQKIIDGANEWLQMHTAFPHPAPLSDDAFVEVSDISAVAVWDTVGALGIPFYNKGAAVDLFAFCDTALHPKIRLGLHAVAIDEERMPFQPTLWDNSPCVVQALFPGGHCDVGGGYAEHGLSDGPLLWMAERLQHPDVGLQLNAEPPVDVKADPLAPRHRAWVSDPQWQKLGVARRQFRPGLIVNDSVRQRRNGKDEILFDKDAPPVPGKPYDPGLSA